VTFLTSSKILLGDLRKPRKKLIGDFWYHHSEAVVRGARKDGWWTKKE
jgi:hypothetical protein